MLFVNFKLPKKAILLIFLLAMAALVVITLISFNKPYKYKLENEQIIADEMGVVEYITSFGPVVDEKSCKVDKILVPIEFNEVYNSYNELQKSQGFDLEQYKGVELTRYTYIVENYTDSEKSVFVEVLLYEGRVVAADIYSTDSDGFIMPLK